MSEPLTSLHSAGYHVSVHRMAGALHLTDQVLPVPDVYVEMHAVRVDADPPDVFVAWVAGEGADVERQCAAELARMVGVG